MEKKRNGSDTQAMIDVCLTCRRGSCPGNCDQVRLAGDAGGGQGDGLYEYRGIRLPLNEWARRFEIDHAALWHRVHKKGWSIERALTTPVRAKRRQYSMTVRGKPVSMIELAAHCNIAMSTVAYRAKQGWTGDQIVEHYGGKRGGQK